MRKLTVFISILAIAMTTWAADIPKSWYKLSDDGTSLKLWKIERPIIDMQGDKTFEKVTVIGKMAFCNLRTLEEVLLPKSVVTIEQSAFEYCAGLKYFTAPEKLESIGRAAFSKCTNLKTVKIGVSVAKIADSAFAGCTALTEIFSDNPIPPSIEANTFDYVDKQNCVLYVPKGSKAKYGVDAGWKEFTKIVER